MIYLLCAVIYFIVSDCLFLQRQTVCWSDASQCTTMSRQRKKRQSSEQQQVSIFDSEEEHPPNKQHKLKNNKNKEKLEKIQKIERKPGRKPTLKNMEKKLSKQEDSIMKTILGQQNKHRNVPNPPLQHQTIPHTKEKKQIYQQPIKQEQFGQVAASTLDTNSRLLDTQLTWIDLQDVTTPKNNYNYLTKQNNNYSIDQYQFSTNNQSFDNQDKSRYPPPYKKPSRKHYVNPYYNNPRYNQYNHYKQPQYDYQQYNNYDYKHNQRIFNRGNYNNYRNSYGQNSRYDEYSGYGYHPYDNKYSLNPSNHIISQMQQPTYSYANFQTQQFFSYNSDIPTQIEQQKKSIEPILQPKKTQQVQLQGKWRREKILQQIQKLKQQYKKIEDENETQTSNNDTIKIEQQTYQPTKLWHYQPIPQPAKYVPPFGDNKDPKYQKSKTQDRILMIDFILKQNPFLTQFQMAEVLRALDPVLNARIQRSVVLRLLKMSGYKKKKIITLNTNRNSEQNLNLRKQFALHYRSLKAQNYSVAYYDQMIINEYYDKESGWCKQNEEVDYKLQRFMSRSLVVIAVLSTQGTCYWQARFGYISDVQYNNIMSKILKKTAQDQPKRVLIANPIPYRRSDYLSQIAARRNWNISVLPKQSLYLNPLQFYFSQMKQRLKRRRYDSLQGMFRQTVQCLKQCDRDGTVGQVVSKIQTFIERAMQRQCF